MPSGKLKKVEKDEPNPVDMLVKSMLDEGGIKMENMIEIQWIFNQITTNANIPKENVEKMVHTMELLINMGNCYLNNYEKLKRL